MVYSSLECPYCESEVTQNLNGNNNCSISGCSGSGCHNHNDEAQHASFVGYDSIPIEEDSGYEPRHYIICPNIHCLHKNSRLEVYCTVCGASLPIHDTRLENKTQDQRITQFLDPKARKMYYKIGLSLFIAKKIEKERKEKCNNIKPDGSRCTQILTPLIKDCPQCGRKHGYYPCATCHNLIPISAMYCKCGSPSYLSDAMKVIDGTGGGEGANRIIQDLENMFEIPLRKQAYSSFVSHDKIISGKSMLTNYARQLKVTLDLLRNFLRDFSAPSKQHQMQDAFTSMYFGNRGVTEINQIGTPSPSEGLLRDIMLDQENRARANNNARHNAPEEEVNDTPEEEVDEQSPWHDTNI
jgi:hypothetical protein